MKTIEERAKEYSAKQTYFVGDKNWYKLVEHIYEDAAKEQARIDAEMQCIVGKAITMQEGINEEIDVAGYYSMENLMSTCQSDPITIKYLLRKGFEKKYHHNGFVDLVKTIHLEKDPAKLGIRRIHVTFFKDIDGRKLIVCRISGRFGRVFEGEIQYIQELHAALEIVGLPEIAIELKK